MICLSPNGQTVFTSSEPSDALVVATAKGVIRLEAKANRWRIAGSALEDCYVSALMPVAGTNLLFASIHRGTIHVSKDGGRSWEPRDKGITHRHVFTLSHVLVEGKIKLYAGTEPAHLFESDDLGENWHELPGLRSISNISGWGFPAPPHLPHVKNIAFDPWDPHVIYVCVEQGGLYRSIDDAKSWEYLSAPIYNDVHRLIISPSDPNRFYVTGGDGLFTSRDAGKSWLHLTTRAMTIAYPDAFVQHPRREKLMFMAGAATSPLFFERSGTANSHIARSQDGGETWELVTGLPQHIRGNVEAMSLEVMEEGYRVFAGNTDGEIFCSTEGGRRWIKLLEGLPPISKLNHYEALEHGAANFEKSRKAS